MDKLTVYVGRVVAGPTGELHDTRQQVEFEGELLGERIEHGMKRNVCGHAGSEGRTETLYKSADGRLLVHVHQWSEHPGKLSIEELHEISETDLLPGGSFALLGAECGFGSSPTWRREPLP